MGQFLSLMTLPLRSLARPQTLPAYWLGVYAILLFLCGWFGGQRWLEHQQSVASPPVINPVALSLLPRPTTRAKSVSFTLPDEETDSEPVPGELPALIYSAHVYSSDEKRRTVTLNNQIYHQGEAFLDRFIIEQIQQDATLFSDGDRLFILDALENWPGGMPEYLE